MQEAGCPEPESSHSVPEAVISFIPPQGRNKSHHNQTWAKGLVTVTAKVLDKRECDRIPQIPKHIKEINSKKVTLKKATKRKFTPVVLNWQ